MYIFAYVYIHISTWFDQCRLTRASECHQCIACARIYTYAYICIYVYLFVYICILYMYIIYV